MASVKTNTVDFQQNNKNTFVFQFTNTSDEDEKHDVEVTSDCTIISNVHDNKLVKFYIDIPVLNHKVNQYRFHCGLYTDFSKNKKTIRIHTYDGWYYPATVEESKRTFDQKTLVAGYTASYTNGVLTAHAEKLTPDCEIARVENCNNQELTASTNYILSMNKPEPMKIDFAWEISYIIKDDEMYATELFLQPKSLQKIERIKPIEKLNLHL